MIKLFNKVKKVFKSDFELMIDALKANKYCGAYHKLEIKIINGKEMIWLNPRDQKCFNFGYYTIQDFLDWTNGKGKIVKGKTDEEKQKFWEYAKFCTDNDFGSMIGYYIKYFDLINDNYSVEHHGNRECKNPLKITKTNHAEIIGNVMGYICRYYSELKLTYASNAYTKIQNELLGANETLFMLGIGYYGACNTPCEVNNLNWITDIAVYKSAYMYMLNNNVIMPDFDFVNNYKEN